MKEKNKFQELKRMTLLCLLCVVGATQGWAFHVADEYVYKTNVKVATGKGTVYVNYTANEDDNSSNTADQNDTDGKDYEATVYSGNNQTTISLNATPAEGYRFLKWEDGEKNIVGDGSTAPIITLTHTQQNSQRQSILIIWNYLYTQDKVYNFTAHFAKNGTVIAKVKTGQESIGSAIIKEQSFISGDKVHLVASNINSSEVMGWFFDHWEREDGVAVENAENKEIEVDVTDDEVTYIAVFNRVDTENYCFLRNKGTGKYLKIIATNDYKDPKDKNNPVGSLNGSFTMVDEDKAVSDPGCVFMVTGSSSGASLKQVSIVSQGQAVGSQDGAKIIKKPLSIRPASSSTYYISFTGQVKDGSNTSNITLYFRDNNGNPDLPSTTTDENSQWELLMLNKANIGTTYFGLAPNELLKKDNKYYTTLYTTFPYELQSGKAYYINDQSIQPYGDEAEGKYRVVCKEVSGKKIPANAAVIIECDGTDPADNKILPLPQSTQITPLEGHQLLHGYTKIQHGGDMVGEGHIYVLSVGKSTGLGFYKLKSGTSLSDNKAYSKLSEEAQSAAKSISFSFGDDDIETPLAIEEVALPENVVGQTIYDLQGRKVKNPSQGIYIVNGKKYVIK